MPKYINADKLRKETTVWLDGATLVMPVQALDDAPAEDVAPVIRGKWTGIEGDQCSNCKHYLSEIMDADSYYAIGFNPKDLVACPFCGAKMDGGKEG